MKAFELWWMGYIANCLWMVPLVFVAAWAAVILAQRVGAALVHKVWVTALMMEIFLPALTVPPGGIRSMLFGLWSGGDAPGGTVKFRMTASTVHASHGITLPHWAIASVLAAYLCATLYFAGQLLWRIAKAGEMARSVCGPVSGEVMTSLQRLAPALGLEDGCVLAAESVHIGAPATVGRRLLLLPPGFAERTAEEDLNAALAHECAHIARHDFLKNIVYNTLALPCAFHPLLGVTKTRIAASREMVCDAMAAGTLRGKENYARSLLRLASVLVEQGRGEIHAIGIFDANNLEDRVMNLTQKTITSGRALRLAMLTACVMLGAITVGSALTLRLGVRTDGTEEAANHPSSDPSRVTMPVLIHSEQPEYPRVSPEDRLSGTCLVSLVVDEQGLPQEVHILRSLRPDFDRNAIAAVKGYRFRPATSDGKPIAKDLKIEVRFAYF
jgi:TonB family protein